MQILTALNLSAITSKYRTVAMFATCNIRKKSSYRSCRRVYDLSPYEMSTA